MVYSKLIAGLIVSTVVSGLLNASQANASLAAICEQSFFTVRPMDRMSLATLNLIHIAGKEGGAFGDREESKFTVMTAQVNSRIENLAELFGRDWKERDKAEPGRENVTETDYVAKMRYRNTLGDERRVKIRFREYLTTDPSDLRLERATNTAGTGDKEWMEVKIQHPTQKKKVIKVRALVFKSDRRYLVDDMYLAYRDQILSRMAALNLNSSNPGAKPLISQEKFDGLVQFLDEVYNSPRKRTGLFARTKYRRRSFAVQLPILNSESAAKDTAPNKTVEIQFTLDDRIQLIRLDDGKRFETYLPDQTVIEVKVPSLYAGFTQADFVNVIGLKTVKDFIDWLETQHDMRLPMNKGKLSKIRPQESKEIDKETERDAESHLEDLYD